MVRSSDAVATGAKSTPIPPRTPKSSPCARRRRIAERGGSREQPFSSPSSHVRCAPGPSSTRASDASSTGAMTRRLGRCAHCSRWVKMRASITDSRRPRACLPAIRPACCATFSQPFEPPLERFRPPARLRTFRRHPRQVAPELALDIARRTHARGARDPPRDHLRDAVEELLVVDLLLVAHYLHDPVQIAEPALSHLAGGCEVGSLGVRQYRREKEGLAEREIVRAGAEVVLGGRADPVDHRAELDDVEIKLEDFVLGEGLLEVGGKH